MHRIILFTGKGGVGKTSVSAATALKCAELGKKTLVISLDMAHSLGDCLNIKLGPEPKKIAENLWAQEAEIQNQVIKEWEVTTNHLKELFRKSGVNEIIADEICDFMILPGVGTSLCLSKIKGYFEKNEFEVIIIDCPPTGETIRLLSASNSMRWYMDHFFETERKIVRVLGPALRAIAGTPYPDKIFYDVSKKMYEMVLEVESFLLDKNISSVRLVVNPEKMVIDESKRAYTYVNLFDYNVDAVVVNKKIPSHLNEPFFEKWKSIQLHESEEIKKVFHSMPILNVELFDQQIGGLEMLKKLGDAIYKDKNAAEILSNNNAHKIIKDGDKNILTLYLPNTNKEDLSIAANNEECIIKVNDYERKIMLPSSMVGYRPIKTKLSNDNLEIVFAKKK